MKVTLTPRRLQHTIVAGDVLHVQHVSDRHECVALVANFGRWFILRVLKANTANVVFGDLVSSEEYITLGIYDEAELVLRSETLF